jgi:hypothetical protein
VTAAPGFDAEKNFMEENIVQATGQAAALDLTEKPGHAATGVDWESEGGAWGGRFSGPEGNDFFPLEYEGLR